VGECCQDLERNLLPHYWTFWSVYRISGEMFVISESSVELKLSLIYTKKFENNYARFFSVNHSKEMEEVYDALIDSLSLREQRTTHQ
jgi:hypothetical protein